jgi:hypothetical protein
LNCITDDKAAITDVLGILTPIFRPVHTGITYIVKPSEFVTDNVLSARGSFDVLLNKTIISSRGSLAEFLGELGQLVHRNHERCAPIVAQRDDDPYLVNLQSLAQQFLKHSKWRAHFGRPVIAYKKYCDENVINLLEGIHNAWCDATSFLSGHQALSRAVLGVHLGSFLDHWEEIVYIQRRMPLRYPKNASEAQRELMKLYFDTFLRDCINTLTTENPALVEKVWVTIIFRGILWHATHNFDDKVVAVPPRYADSNMPIYLS